MHAGEVRQIVSEYLRRALGARWSEAPLYTGETRPTAAYAWRVTIGDTDAADGRQTTGATAQITEVHVDLTVRLRADGALPDVVGWADLDLALEAEAEVLEALSLQKLSTGAYNGPWLNWRGVTRGMDSEAAYHTSNLRYAVLHST